MNSCLTRAIPHPKLDGFGVAGNNSQTSGPPHQPQVNLDHVTREEGSVPGDFSETEHGDEGFLRQTTRRSPPLPPQDPVSQQGEGQLEDPNGATEMGKERPKSPSLELSPLLDLPLVPTNRFPRGEFVNEVLDFTDQVASTALFGPIGVGKSTVALTLLHHNRTEVKFGGSRYFMRCDNLTNSLEDFLERLSDAIHANRTTDIAQLRSHLESSPPLILLLDGVDLILDPLAPGAKDILATIEEFGSYGNVCLLTTSRIYPDIPGFHRVEVPTLSEDSARGTFYGLCNMSRSPAVDDLIARLDFHPLSIDFLASSVRENNWDEVMLLKAWVDNRAGTLKTNYYQRMREAMEPFLHSPTIQNIETSARTVLGAVAAYTHGFEERRLQNTFANVIGIGETVNVLCRFSLVYRQDGFVKMLLPFQFYFLESLPVEPPQHPESIHIDPANCSAAKACMSLSVCFTVCKVTLLKGFRFTPMVRPGRSRTPEHP